jgi:hypothetical protein
MPLEIEGAVRADCALPLNSPLRKCAEVGSCNPRSRRLDFALSPIAALRVARNKRYTVLKTAMRFSAPSSLERRSASYALRG